MIYIYAGTLTEEDVYKRQGYQVFVIQHFKEYLAGYIIRIVAGQDKRFSVK